MHDDQWHDNPPIFKFDALELHFSVNGIPYTAILKNEKTGGLVAGNHAVLMNATATQVLDEISTHFGGSIARFLADVSAKTMEG